jgi:hypothetical protein
MIEIQYLLWSLVNGHCGQQVETKGIKAGNGMIKQGPGGEFSSLGAPKVKQWKTPLADYSPPAAYLKLDKPACYAKMLADKMSVRTLFEAVTKEKIVKNYYQAGGNKYEPQTCGVWDPKFMVEISENTHPQSTTTGNNHNGPAEVWIDDVMTSHISNLHGAQPEVLSREKYNCNKASCLYRWYWIVFRADQKPPHFQVWVQCATIKGNGKSPISVQPTGNWLVDPRFIGKKGNTKVNPTPNKPGAEISKNNSERRANAGYDNGYRRNGGGNQNGGIQGQGGNPYIGEIGMVIDGAEIQGQGGNQIRMPIDGGAFQGQGQAVKQLGSLIGKPIKDTSAGSSRASKRSRNG